MAGVLAEPNIAETGESLVSLTMQAVYAHIGDARLPPEQVIPSESAFAVQIGLAPAAVRKACRLICPALTAGTVHAGNPPEPLLHRVGEDPWTKSMSDEMA
jgi:hypothetical protein